MMRSHGRSPVTILFDNSVAPRRRARIAGLLSQVIECDPPEEGILLLVGQRDLVRWSVTVNGVASPDLEFLLDATLKYGGGD